MNVTPIGGKSPSSTLVGIAVDAYGVTKTKKEWENPVETIFEGTYEDTVVHTQTGVAVSDCGLFSLRVANTTDSTVNLTFRSDVTSNDVALKNPEGTNYEINVAQDSRFMMITPDDYPFMQWIRNLRLGIKFNAVPTTGTLTIYLVKKK